MSRITLPMFKKVVRKVLRDTGMEPKEANDIAEKVMNIFGYDNVVTDNILTTEERNHFYLLEDHDILTSEEETVTLPSGKHWRIHYWRIKENKIHEILEEVNEEEEADIGVYDEIYDEVWERVEEQRY